MPWLGACTSNNDTNSSTGTQSIFTTPVGSAAGDVVDIYLCEVTGSNTINSTPANANLRDGPDYSSGSNFGVYHYTLTLTAPQANGGTFTFQWSGNARIIESANVFTGVTETGIQFGATQINSGAATSVPMTSITTTVACDLSMMAGTRVASGAPPTISMPSFTVDKNSAEATAGVNLGAACGHLNNQPAATYNSLSATFSSVPQSGGFVTAFPLSGGTAWTASPTDSAGLTDSIAVDQEKNVTDSVGLTDSIAVNQNKGVTDSVGLTDSIIVDRQIVIMDSMGFSDSVIQQGNRFITITDNMGLLDAYSAQKGGTFVPVKGGTDAIIAELAGLGFTTGTLLDRERARLLAQLTLTPQQGINLTLYDLYKMNGEHPRLVGAEN